MRTKRWMALMLVSLVTLSACQGKSSRNDYAMEAAPTFAPANAVYGGFAAKEAASYDWDAEEDVYEEEAYFDADMDDVAYYDTASTRASSSSMDTGAGEPETAETGADGEGQLQREKLVYNGSLTVETTAFQETLTRIKATISEMGGFIEWESDNDNSYGWYREDYRKSSSTLSSSLQVRIPSARFHEFLDGIEGEGAKVTSRYVNVENISRRYAETALSVESYEIQERRLLDMMEEAKKVSDMLEIEDRLTQVQNSLKQLKNSLSSMDTDVAYSTVNIQLNEVGIYSQPRATTFGEKVREAFDDGIDGFVNGVQLFALWLVRNFLSLLVFIAVLLVAVAVLKRLAARLRKKWAKRKETPEDIGKVKE